jgi:hypothetical protein
MGGNHWTDGFMNPAIKSIDLSKCNCNSPEIKKMEKALLEVSFR